MINLESYQGNEVILCDGYQLLDDFANRTINAHAVCHTHGILAFAGKAEEDTISGSSTPSLT